jgi:AcrR family transcriptional regulator
MLSLVLAIRSRTTVAPRRVRLKRDARRQQLVELAAKLLTEHGPSGVEVTAVAEAAKITRPVVYRLFPSRDALLAAVMDDLVTDLAARYHAALVGSLGAPIDRVVSTFIDASCDAIEAKGAGPWRLLYLRGADASAAALGRAALHRLLAPWLPRIGELTGLPPARVELLADVVVAAGGAALDGWLDGRMRRRDAAQIASRAVTALLRELSRR